LLSPGASPSPPLPAHSSFLRTLTLHFLRRPYAFDIHANSFFPLFLQLYVAQLVLAPVVTRSNWVCLWVGNTLYLAAFVQYTYVTYLGYAALPFIVRGELLLFPVAVFATFYVVSLLGLNLSHVILEFLFGV
jgi:hypothetical protein